MELIIYRKLEPNTVLYDECDHELVSKHKWHINKHGYAQSTIRCEDGKQRNFQMHRLILGVTDPKIEVDHIRHKKLDNRRSELRVCTKSQNQRNKTASGKSKYLGVSFHRSPKRGGGFYEARARAEITIDGRSKHLGYFNTPEAAARAYDQKAKELFGEFANLNFKTDELQDI